jgi:hypothetical protein
MTEQEWLECTDLRPILKRARKKSERKLRLFAAACCRRVWHLFPHPTLQEVVSAVERFVDGGLSREELLASKEHAKEAAWRARVSQWDWSTSAVKTYHAILAITAPNAGWVARTVSGEVALARWFLVPLNMDVVERSRVETAVWRDELTAHCALARDILGNPFRPVTVDRAWFTRTAIRLAQAGYEERALPAGTLEPDRLAILADALEDAGCDDANILGHLRSPGPHVRGCWALDLLLGKS